MTDVVAQITIRAALEAGHTDLKLTGELSKIGIGGQWGTFANNTQITTCDLTAVTGWGTTPTLPELAFKDCTKLQEVTLPDDVQVIGEYAFIRCAALTTVNLSQVTRIDESAFWGKYSPIPRKKKIRYIAKKVAKVTGIEKALRKRV